MTLLARDRSETGPRSHRPAVVESVDFPPSTSDGRTINFPIAPVRMAGAASAAAAGSSSPSRLRTQLVRFAAIGVVSTLAWAGLYSLLRGAGLGSVAANALALVTTAVGNTAANRRLTFGVTGRDGLARDHGAGLLAFGIAISITTAAATLLDRLAPGSSRIVELGILGLANVVATAGRFALLRAWIGRASPLRVT